MSVPTRLGLFGGSFNPVHVGHLIMAEQAREQLDLDQVLLAPAGNPPHKAGQRLASIADRMEMTGLAVAGNDGLVCSDLDARGDEPSFTWRLLERLHDAHPGADLWFIMGGDSLLDFTSWARPERILELAKLAIVERPGSTLDRVQQSTTDLVRGRVDLIEAPLCAVSSSDIRSRIERHHSVRYLVPDPVRQYIDDGQLYR